MRATLALTLLSSTLLLAFAPTASAIPPLCDTPPHLSGGGAVQDLYNGVRDPASGACHGATDSTVGFVVAQCEFQLGSTCPL